MLSCRVVTDFLSVFTQEKAWRVSDGLRAGLQVVQTTPARNTGNPNHKQTDNTSAQHRQSQPQTNRRTEGAIGEKGGGRPGQCGEPVGGSVGSNGHQARFLAGRGFREQSRASIGLLTAYNLPLKASGGECGVCVEIRGRWVSQWRRWCVVCCLWLC